MKIPSTLRHLADVPTLYLRGHQELEQVSLHWTAAGDGAVAALAGKRALSRIVLGSQLTDTGVARLRDFPALTAAGDRDSFLAISGGRTLTDRALADIGELKGFAALDVHTSAFGNPYYTASVVAHLNRLPSLEALSPNFACASASTIVTLLSTSAAIFKIPHHGSSRPARRRGMPIKPEMRG